MITSPTREQVEVAFRSHETVHTDVFYYWMNTDTGQIFGTCGDDTCEVGYDNLDEFLKYNSLEDLWINQ